MEIATFSGVFNWLLGQGYLLMFLIMLIEGPLVTAAASFAAALGYFNIWIVLVLAFFGDFLSDLVHYGVGYFGRHRLVDKYGHRVGLTHERMAKIEKQLRRRAVKGLILLKFLPFVPTFGLLTAGAIRMPLPKFALTVGIIIIPRVLLYGAVGYYFGQSYGAVSRYLNNIQNSFLILAIASLTFYFAYRKLVERARKKLEKI